MVVFCNFSVIVFVKNKAVCLPQKNGLVKNLKIRLGPKNPISDFLHPKRIQGGYLGPEKGLIFNFWPSNITPALLSVDEFDLNILCLSV